MGMKLIFAIMDHNSLHTYSKLNIATNEQLSFSIKLYTPRDSTGNTRA